MNNLVGKSVYFLFKYVFKRVVVVSALTTLTKQIGIGVGLLFSKIGSILTKKHHTLYDTLNRERMDGNRIPTKDILLFVLLEMLSDMTSRIGKMIGGLLGGPHHLLVNQT